MLEFATTNRRNSLQKERSCVKLYIDLERV